MRFSIIALATPLLLATTAFAGFNCKCQDANGQYNDSTRFCCEHQSPGGHQYHEFPHHQCTNSLGKMDNGAFVGCCVAQGRGGAYCWT